MKLSNQENLVHASHLVVRVLCAEQEFLAYLYGMCASHFTKMQFPFEAVDCSPYASIYPRYDEASATSVYVRALGKAVAYRFRLNFVTHSFNRDSLLSLKRNRVSYKSYQTFLEDNCTFLYTHTIYIRE